MVVLRFYCSNPGTENEYADVANNIYSKIIPITENEIYIIKQRPRMKVNFSMFIYSIFILFIIFLLGYIAKGLISPSNNENGTYFIIQPGARIDEEHI